jgi:hypothetical protein
MEEKYGVETVGWCTNDGPDGKKMRRLAALIWPWLVFIFCWAHQIELICKAISKASHHYENIFALANNIVKHVNNHDMVLKRVQEETEQLNKGKSWALTLPAATRWSSRYQTVSRLLKVEEPMRNVYYSDRSLIAERIGQDET